MEMTLKRIGVWLDHSKAHLIPADNSFNGPIQTVYSEHDDFERIEGKGADGTRWGNYASNNEERKENKSKQRLDLFYKALEKGLEQYDEILIFGPTTAKNELKNLMEDNKHFSGKIIHIEKAEQITENQLKAFVRDYFTGKEPDRYR